ncbi:hypothetical protein [Streptomyces yanii]
MSGTAICDHWACLPWRRTSAYGLVPHDVHDLLHLHLAPDEGGGQQW